MLQTVCQHCDTEVPEGRRFCDRCGAPTASAQLQAPDCPPGYQVYTHTWMGYSFHYPENWHVSLAPEGGAFIETSSGEAILELHLLPPRAMTTAPRQAELFLSRFGAVQFQVMPGSTDSYAQVVFANQDWQGMVSVHLSPRGGTIGVGRLINGSALNLEPYFEQLMNSITPVKPIARQPWVDPIESSFCIHCPAGWKPHSSINPSPGAGSRVPVFTVSAEFANQVFVVRDMQTRIFINGPLPEKPPAEEGFFGKLGRMANNLGNSMASACVRSREPLIPTVTKILLRALVLRTARPAVCSVPASSSLRGWTRPHGSDAPWRRERASCATRARGCRTRCARRCV